jgi:hypothetical protein
MANLEIIPTRQLAELVQLHIYFGNEKQAKDGLAELESRQQRKTGKTA